MKKSIQERTEIWNKFLKKWPIENLGQLTLDEYCQANTRDGFIYWLEAITQSLGSIWGGSAFKFGIFARGNLEPRENESGRAYSEKYAWYSRYGNSEQEAFEAVRALVEQIAKAARAGDLERIEEINFSLVTKWKIAFLYQNRASPCILPIYGEELLKATIGASARSWKHSRIYRYLLSKENVAPLSEEGLFSYYDELLERAKVERLKQTKQDDKREAENSGVEEKMVKNENKNLILYGPPGTGKTYSSILCAVSIVEEKALSAIKAENYDDVFIRYRGYVDDGLIAFTTFHQSFGYEEFVEGIRPVIASAEESEAIREFEYEIRDGIFKAFCDKAGAPDRRGASVDLGFGKNPTVWKVSLEATGDNPTRSECMDNNHIRIGWDQYGETILDSANYSGGGRTVLNAFYNRMQIGDIVFSCYSSKTVDAIGVITGEPEWREEYPGYKRLRKVRWLAKGISENIVDLNAGKTMTLSTVYKLSVPVSDAIQLLRKVSPALFTQDVKIPNRVFIIDEINRGNISKIFGELITLIESSKRIGAKEELRAKLPYSGQNFGVPDNVYIIGTMNTADRSIALIDTALRRRFDFVEMQPDSATLKGVLVSDINVANMLDTLNKRIAVLLDRERTIGHSYLLPLKTDPTIKRLGSIFKNKIIPLLQEYFYDDYEKIQFVLGDNQKPDDSARFVVKKNDAMKLFGNADTEFRDYYEINGEAFEIPEAYAFIG